MTTTPTHPGRLSENVAHFVRLLRAAGLPVGPGHTITAARALAAVDITAKQQFYWALHGTLVSRSKEGSVLHDVEEVAERSLRMVREGRATAVNGDTIDVEADSLCIHGDTPGAVEMAKVLRQQLDTESVAVTPLSQLV